MVFHFPPCNGPVHEGAAHRPRIVTVHADRKRATLGQMRAVKLKEAILRRWGKNLAGFGADGAGGWFVKS